MDLFWRILRAHHILSNRRTPVGFDVLRERLQCSPATLKRIVRHMRDALGAPIEFDRQLGGYRYSPQDKGVYGLPGLWFSAAELQALLATEELLARTQPGLLGELLGPLRKRIEAILASEHLGAGEATRRVRILRMAARREPPEEFSTVAGALMQRKRLRLRYRGRTSDMDSARTISPQRLVHYRDNWYLDAWDHGRRALRTFSVDRIAAAQILELRARDVPDEKLDHHFADSYGIFAGRPRHRAVLRFSTERARWVADEEWHPQQQATRLADGRYELAFPYADPRELVMDILKHGAEVEVISPPSLRLEVARQLERAARQYRLAGPESDSSEKASA